MRLYTLKEKDNITQIEFQLFCEYDKILLLDLLNLISHKNGFNEKISRSTVDYLELNKTHCLSIKKE